jgi:hypothetical protein
MSDEPLDFSKAENQLRKVANSRLLKLLKDPDADVPPGQLMAFVAKVGFQVQADKPEQTTIKQQNILAILPGLPEDRREQIAGELEKQARAARKLVKELPSGE